MNEASGRRVRVFRLSVFVFRFISRTSGAEPTLVVSLINRIPTFGGLRSGHTTPKLRDALIMKWLGRSHKNIVTTVFLIEPKLGRHLFVIVDDVIGLLLRCTTCTLGCALDINPVLVRAGQKERLYTSLSLMTSDRVCHDHR